jgi:phage terminase large subunit-like protein
MSAALQLEAVKVADGTWSTAVPDWEERILQGRSLVPDLPLNLEEAERAVRVFNRLRIPDIVGRPTFGEVGGAWFLDIVRAVFGSYDPATDQRVIQEIFVLVPKKNAKTTNAAGLMVTAMILNRAYNAEGTFLAPTKEIADLAFGQAMGMIGADEQLTKKFHLQRHGRRITHRDSGAFLLVKAADTDAVTGSKQHFTLVDETHVFAAHPRAREVFLEIRGALAARPGGFFMQITTQSKKPPSGVFKSELDRAREVRDGKRAQPMLAVLYELPRSMQVSPTAGVKPAWYSPATFGLVNPNLGRSARPEFLARELANAEEEGIQALALCASQYLNIEIGVGLNTDGWAGAEHWTGAAEEDLTLESLLERSEVVTVGIDGGGLDDLFGFAVIGRERETRRWLLWLHALISPAGLDRRKANLPQYQGFIDDGDLTLVDRLPADLDWIRDHVGLILDSGLLGKVGADPAGIGGLVDALAEIGVTEESKLLTGVAQGIRLMGAAKTLERKLVDGSLEHDGSRLAAWCVGNAKVRQTSTAVLIERAASGYGKIDPFMAALNAAHLMSLNPPAQGGSIYDDPVEYAAAFGPASEPAQPYAGIAAGEDDAIDRAILDDPRHPRWNEMRERFERHLDALDEDMDFR